MMVPTNIDI